MNVVLRNGLFDIVHNGINYLLIKKGEVLVNASTIERVQSLASRIYKVRGEWVKP